MRFVTFLVLILIYRSISFADCPATIPDWIRWRDNLIKTATSEKAFSEAALQIKSCEAMDTKSAKALSDPALTSCMDAVLAVGGGKNLTTPLDQKPEAIEAKLTAFPDNLIDAKLRRLIAEGPIDKAQAALREAVKKYPDAKVIRRDSGAEHGDTEEKNLILILPGKESDHYYNFFAGGQILMIGIRHDANHTAVFAGTSTSDTTKRSFDTQHCIKCHRTGAMPLLERSDSFGKMVPFDKKDNTKANTDWLINRIRSTGHTEVVGGKTTEVPAMGPSESPYRTFEFMRRCSTTGAGKELPFGQITKIQDAMNCVRCHNDKPNGAQKNWGKISSPFAPKLLHGAIDSGYMPPGADKSFSPAERAALLRCLVEEYYGGFGGISKNESGLLKDYLVGKSCGSGSEKLVPKTQGVVR